MKISPATPQDSAASSIASATRRSARSCVCQRKAAEGGSRSLKSCEITFSCVLCFQQHARVPTLANPAYLLSLRENIARFARGERDHGWACAGYVTRDGSSLFRRRDHLRVSVMMHDDRWCITVVRERRARYNVRRLRRNRRRPGRDPGGALWSVDGTWCVVQRVQRANTCHATDLGVNGQLHVLTGLLRQVHSARRVHASVKPILHADLK